jgi:TonB dependent receptor
LRGTYRLTATAAGFKTFVADNIILETNQVRRINISFELGAVSAEVTVSAAAAVISTDSAKIQGQFTRHTIEEAPLLGDGRNPGMLLSTLPQIQQSGNSIYSVEMAGQSGGQIQEGIDGHTSDGVINQVSSIDVMQELVAVSVNNSAEFSRVGYYNMITKSGTNDFHGQAYYWMRNSALDARDFFAATKPKAKSHTMHADVGGPIIKNKTFFFGSWGGQRWPGGSYYLQSVPTQSMRQGDFSQLLTLAKPVVIKDPLNGLPFPGNIIPAARLNATTLKAQDGYIPAPNLGGPNALSNNYGYLWPWPTDLRSGNWYMGRIDHQFSSNNRLYGRWMMNAVDYDLAGTYPTLGWTRIRHNRDLVIEDTHIFSPSLVNTVRFGLYWVVVDDGETVDGFTPKKGGQVVKDLGIQGVNPQNLSAQGFPQMDIAGYASLAIPDSGGGNIQDYKDWGYADSLTWSKGRHVVKFGAEFKPFSQFNGQIPSTVYGSYSFNGSMTGYGQADFLLGVPFSSTRLNPLINRTQLDSETGIYVQDAFKVNSRLTLDLGLRWERFGAATYSDGLIYNWDPSTSNVIVPPDAINHISPLYPTNTIHVVTGSTKQQPSLHNIVPRVGVAYRPFDERTVIRGSYGIFTEALGEFARAQGGGPYQLTETFFNSIQNGTPLFAFPNPFPAGAGSIPSQSVTGYPLDTSNGRIHQFNFTIERQIHDIGFRLSYLGSRSRGLNYNINTDIPMPSLTPFSQSRRPLPQFVGTTYARHDGAANYNALTFEAKRKVGQVTFDSFWTWASNYSKLQDLENPYAPLVWSRDPYTSRHRVVLNTVWDIPVGRGRHYLSNAPGVINQVLGGWQLYWIAYLETGQYFSPSYSGADPSNTNTFSGLPSRTCNGNLPSSQRSITHWFDPSCFTVPTPGTFGNASPYILEGPGLQEHNLTISKTFKATERLRLNYSAAIQNLFNHPNFWNPSANISAPQTVGVISSTRSYVGPRQIMMRLKVDF